MATWTTIDYELCCNNLECFRQFNLPYLLPDKMEAFQAIYKVFRKTKKKSQSISNTAKL